MAINVYCGLMGSGKSYEAVSSVIVPAIASGRRVVSNISGLNQDEIVKFILARPGKFSKKKTLAREDLGQVVFVSNDQIFEPLFFPDAEHADGVETVVKPGDLVVIDEAWRCWPKTGVAVTHEHKQFFKMHRHYAHSDTGVTCDLALIIQDISGLFQDLKVVVENTFRMTKLKALGLSRRYRVDVYEGYRLIKLAKISSYQKSYDKRVFPLYKSYDSVNATEKVIDGRQSIFNGFKVWIIGILIVAIWGGGGWYLYGYFGGGKSVVKDKPVALPVRSGAVGGVLGTKAVPGGSAAVSPEVKKDTLSASWQIVGSTFINDFAYVVLKNSMGRLRYEPMVTFEDRGVLMRGVVDGDRVTTYSGQPEVAK